MLHIRVAVLLYTITSLVVSVNAIENVQILAMVPETGSWPNGKAIRFVGDVALEHINAHPHVLPDYNLSIAWADTQCQGGRSTYMLCSFLHQPPIKLFLLGEVCSKASKPLAEMSHYYNLTQISYDSVSPVLSDKSLYPNFFRMWPPSTSEIPPRIAMFQYFGWKRIALMYTSLSDKPIANQRMVQEMIRTNISVVTSEVFQEDPEGRVANLKKHDAKIIIADYYQNIGAKIICDAFHIGLISPKAVWILPDWYTYDWWYAEESDCTEEQLVQAIDGILYTGGIHENDDLDQVGVSGYSARQLDDLLTAKRKVLGLDKPADLFAYYERFYFYDTIWAAALALNATQGELDRNGKKISDFTYADGAMGRMIKSNMAKLTFVGSKGFVEWDKNGDPSTTIRVTQQRGAERKLVAFWKPGDTGEFGLQWQNGGIQWPGGRVPSDSTIIRLKKDFLNRTTYLVLCSFSALGVFLAVVFLFFNIIFRKKREIKLSSPNMNNIILIGCVFCYVTIFLNTQREEDAHIYCICWPICLTMGMSLVFGALLSKTWRVHVIFRSKTSMNVKIKDHQLIGLVVVLVLINLVILIIWEIVDPKTVHYIDTTIENMVEGGQDVTVQHQVAVCFTEYSYYFSGALYIIQGLLLVFGAFLAWETRKVKVEALNDSQLIGTCIYNVFILSMLGVGLNVALKHETLLVSILTSIFLLLATFATKCVIFLPKVVKVIRGQADVVPTTMNTGTNSTSTTDTTESTEKA